MSPHCWVQLDSQSKVVNFVAQQDRMRAFARWLHSTDLAQPLVGQGKTCALNALSMCPTAFELVNAILPDLPPAPIVDAYHAEMGRLATNPYHQAELPCNTLVKKSPQMATRLYPQHTNEGSNSPSISHTYLLVTVIPHGSTSGIQELLMSSPHVSYAGPLIQGDGNVGFPGSHDWPPDEIDWDSAFEEHRLHTWNMSQSILVVRVMAFSVLRDLFCFLLATVRFTSA